MLKVAGQGVVSLIRIKGSDRRWKLLDAIYVPLQHCCIVRLVESGKAWLSLVITN